MILTDALSRRSSLIIEVENSLTAAVDILRSVFYFCFVSINFTRLVSFDILRKFKWSDVAFICKDTMWTQSQRFCVFFGRSMRKHLYFLEYLTLGTVFANDAGNFNSFAEAVDFMPDFDPYISSF